MVAKGNPSLFVILEGFFLATLEDCLIVPEDGYRGWRETGLSTREMICE